MRSRSRNSHYGSDHLTSDAPRPAWLLPLASFVLIVFFGKRMGHGGKGAGYLATGAIVSGFVLSLTALVCWLSVHPLAVRSEPPGPVSGDWYTLGQFGSLSLTIGYYIDSLTHRHVLHGHAHRLVHPRLLAGLHARRAARRDRSAGPLENGEPLVRRGRFYRFFQFLSLFCFSMLGLVIAGNLAMVFAFWELVGICSYLLIGFYIERKSASNAANKAFIVNRVGDFGMIIGLMAIFAGMGTFNFGDCARRTAGIFSQVRPAGTDRLKPAAGGETSGLRTSNTLHACPTAWSFRRTARKWPRSCEPNVQRAELPRDAACCGTS